MALRSLAIEGRREIKEAQLRLAAAKTHALITSVTYQNLLYNVDAASKDMVSAHSVVAEAERFLLEVEERWKMNDVYSCDVSGGSLSKGSSSNNKRRRVSIMPEDFQVADVGESMGVGDSALPHTPIDSILLVDADSSEGAPSYDDGDKEEEKSRKEGTEYDELLSFALSERFSIGLGKL